MSGRLTEAEWIWKDGNVIPWRDATVHLLSTAVQFGSSVFEGIRCYSTPEGPAIFRLDDHLRRLEDSCRIYRMPLAHSRADLARACARMVDENGLDSCYIRPMVLWGYGAAGMVPAGSPLETYISCWPWGTYLGEGALENGVDVCVSTWLRPHPNTLPTMAKAAGHYNNAQLIKMEALAGGFAEGIALAPDGRVSEGSGQNLFLVRDGELLTSPLDGTNLHGITRASILVLARELGIPLREVPIPRELLYASDEAFFTGTAAEVTPIRSVDRITVGQGRRGEVTRRLQERFLAIAEGQAEDPYGWRAPVRGLLAVAPAAG